MWVPPFLQGGLGGRRRRRGGKRPTPPYRYSSNISAEDAGTADSVRERERVKESEREREREKQIPVQYPFVSTHVTQLARRLQRGGEGRGGGPGKGGERSNEGLTIRSLRRIRSLKKGSGEKGVILLSERGEKGAKKGPPLSSGGC